MFVVNQLFGSMLVQPDWDAQLQLAVRYCTLGVSVYFMDVFEVVSHMETFYG